jgi:hypothetical protein
VGVAHPPPPTSTEETAMAATPARPTRRRPLALVAALALTVLATVGASAGTASAVAPRPPLAQTVCEFAGGLYVQEDGYFLCYLPDGSVIICVDGVGCTSVPAPRRAAVQVANIPLTPLEPLAAT